MTFNDSTQQSFYKYLWFLILAAALVNVSSLFVPIMEPDAGIYASVAKNMVVRNDYINLWLHNKDWLDKPHLPFWLTAFCFKLLGMHTWVYKLPAVLCSMLAAYYTFLFGKKFYNHITAMLASFILLTSFHFTISNNDVRAEPFLTFFIIAAVYHFSCALAKSFSLHTLAACFFTACALMTKGVFTIIPIGAAVSIPLILKGQWKELLHWKWIVVLLLVLVFITPELYALYTQFDLHPEKKIFGKTNVSGLRFFFWDSQVGRFFGNGPIVNATKGSDPLFFIHTLLWAFLPWSLLMYGALFKTLQNIFLKKAVPELLSISSICVTLILFSFSGFQLPFYTNILFPAMALLTAHFIQEHLLMKRKLWGTVQYFISILLLLAVILLVFIYKPGISVVFIICICTAFCMLFFFYRMFKTQPLLIPYLASGYAAVLLYLFLNLSFYPDIFRYQSSHQMAAYSNKQYPGISTGLLSLYVPAAGFYLKSPLHYVLIDEIRAGNIQKPFLLFVSSEELAQLQKENIAFRQVKVFEHFNVSQLNGKFINIHTRNKVLSKRYLLLFE